MTKLLEHLWPAVALIFATSAVLLITDMDRREGTGKQMDKAYPDIAVMQIASTLLLDSHVAGIRSYLEEAGQIAPGGSNLHLFNPQGDFSTANSVAGEIVKGDYDLVITSSTVALQVVAKANQSVKKPHVFGAVTDPYSSGVGITGPNAEDHPPYMAGIGTFQPVENVFRLAKTMNSSLSRVGVVWNPGEQCSEACLIKARAVCAELGITLVEAMATNSSEVQEALRSLLSKGIQAIWIGGDTVAIASAGMIVHLAQQDGIPVFSNDPTDTNKGVLLGLGADYFTVGRHTGEMATAILNGRLPSDFRISNMMPEQLSVNVGQLKERFSKSWRLTSAIKSRLETQKKSKGRTLRPRPGRTYRIALSYIVPAPVFEEAIGGFKERLTDLGFVEGKNLELTINHANGEMSMLPQVTRGLTRSKPDVLVAMSTPSLGSAIAHGGDLPIVFGIVSAPLEAGAGKSLDHHLSNVTGVWQKLPSKELFERARELFPGARSVGALYNPSEANSVKETEDMESMLEYLSFELVKVAVFNTSEIPENIQGLLLRSVDLVFVMGDNTVANGLPAILKAARAYRIPVLAEDSSLMGSGALMSCAPGPWSDGRSTAELAVRVMLGEKPANIPIRTGGKNELTLDLKAAAQYNIIFPDALLKRADRYFNTGVLREKPARIAMVNLVNNFSLDQAEAGVEQGLQDRGFKPGTDYVLTRYNAQGDMGQLTQILDEVVTSGPDLLITVTTPVLMAAVKKIKEIPIVFTVASNPKKLNLFPGGRPANVCGVHDNPPVDAVLQMAMRHNMALKSIGIIYDPSQNNSMISVEKLRKSGKARNINIIEATASNVSDLSMATQSVIQRGADAIILSADNLTTTGFPSIYKAARAKNISIFVTGINLIKKGATGGMGDNYASWGRQSGRMAAQILVGVSPASLPIEPTASMEVVEPSGPALHWKSTAVSKPLELRLVMYSETQFAEEGRDGLLDGLKKGGLVEGRDFNVRIYNAQGDMSTLSSIMTAIKSERPDLLMVISTPSLQAALRLAGKETKIVFTCVGDGVRAGAGTSEIDHLPNVTGITTRSSFKGMARTIHETLPGVNAVGTLFTPAEINSVLYKNWFAEALKVYDIELETVPVTSSSETSQACDILLRKNIQAVAQIVDNTTCPGFAQIARRARGNDLPVYVFNSSQMKDGGVICLSRDYYDAGLEGAEKALRVLNGENPGTIPFNNTKSEKFLLNADLAAKYKLIISPKLKAEAVPFKIPENP